MPMTVPMQRGGAKSLPAEIKTGGAQNGLMRLKASSPGYPFRGMRGLGDDGTDVTDTSGIDLSTINTGSLPDFPNPITTPVPVDLPPVDLSSISNEIPASLIGAMPTGYTGPTVVVASAATPAAPSGYQWATMLNQSGQTIAKVLAVAQGGSTVTLPNGTSLVYGSPASAVAGAGANLFTSSTGVGGLSIGTLVLLAGGLILLSSLDGSGRR